MNTKPLQEEPPINEQMGFTGPPGQRRHARPSLFNTKMQVLNGYELWITPYNRIFLVNEKTGELGYPSLLAAGVLHFEPPLVGVPPDVLATVTLLLEKQKKLRRTMVEQGEFDDGDAWEWS